MSKNKPHDHIFYHIGSFIIQYQHVEHAQTLLISKVLSAPPDATYFLTKANSTRTTTRMLLGALEAKKLHPEILITDIKLFLDEIIPFRNKLVHWNTEYIHDDAIEINKLNSKLQYLPSAMVKVNSETVSDASEWMTWHSRNIIRAIKQLADGENIQINNPAWTVRKGNPFPLL